MDAPLLVTSFITDAWRKGEVVQALYMDIQSAFPRVHMEALFYELKLKGIPTQYMDWIRWKMKGRKTKLQHNNHISELLEIHNGSNQGCPLSIILFIFYNAGLIELLPEMKQILAMAFVDDIQ